MSKEIMQQALNALEYHTEHTYPFHQTNVAMEALQKALAQPEPVQVRPHEFIAMASKQANMVGKPVVWAEYPTSHKIILDEGWEWGHEARAKEALAQPEQKLIGWKDGEPQYIEQPEQTKCPRCGEVNPAEIHTCSPQVAQPEQEPKLSDAGVDTNIPLWGLEPKGKGMLTFHQHNPEHQPWCDYLNIMLTSMPPQRANCNCKTAQPEPKSISTNDHLCAMLRQVHDVLACTALPMKRPWVGLTEDDVAEVERWVEFKEAGSGQIVIGKLVRYIELKLRSKNNAF